MKALRTPQVLPSITSHVSSQQPQRAGQHWGWITPTHPAPAHLHSDFLLPSLRCVLFAMGISKVGFRKTLEMANGTWKNQGSFYNR